VTGCGRAEDHEHVFSSRAEGVAVRYPDDWRLTTRNDNYVPDPALCFDLAPNADTKVDLRVVEYLPPYFNPRYLSGYQPRPQQFQLASFRKGDEDWSPGKTLSFQEERRVFFVGLGLPAKTAPAIRRSIEAILDSMKISAAGRCRPTAGVGSHGVPTPDPRTPGDSVRKHILTAAPHRRQKVRWLSS
jgi:hypothetical protein